MENKIPAKKKEAFQSKATPFFPQRRMPKEKNKMAKKRQKR